MAGSTQYDEYRSQRDAVFKYLDRNLHASLDAVMEFLQRETVFIEPKRQTVKNYRSQWRYQYSRNASVPGALHFGLGRLDSGFPRVLWEAAAGFKGWKVCRGNNPMRYTRVNEISLQWHDTGTVMFRFKGSRPLVHLKTAFVSAFAEICLSQGGEEKDVFNRLHALFDEKYRPRGPHHVYPGVPFQGRISDFKGSHGLEFVADGSHRCFEVKENTPYWLSDFGSIVNKLGEQIQSHLDLVRIWKEENDRQHWKGQIYFDDADVSYIAELVSPELPGSGLWPHCRRPAVLTHFVKLKPPAEGSQLDVQGWGFICGPYAEILSGKLRERGVPP